MSDAKDNESFLRKVVRFVANPTTDWADLSQRPEELRETDYAKTELKQMIERKRRNDFVRKREFDMLRKVRREGLTSEQLAALGGSSRLDDSDGRLQEAGAKADYDVKAKINAIERQMVGEGFGSSTRRPPGSFYEAATSPSPLNGIRPGAAARRTAPADLGEPTQAGGLAQPSPARTQTESGRVPFAATPRSAGAAPPRPPAATAVAPAIMSAALPPLSSSSLDAGVDFANPFAVEVSEVAHDPELDEAVIAFANADFEQCEQSLSTMTGPGGSRSQHAETWLVRFDLYRAIGEQNKFESLALDYAQQFGWSAPQWFSMPRLVAEARTTQQEAAGNGAAAPRMRIDGNVGWACPAEVDVDVVARLHSQTLQMPLPWVFDWNAVERIDPESCARLSELFRHWAGERLEMRWLGGDRLLGLLAEASPTGVKDVDPAIWQLRLDALRLANRADQFDEAAIDYCVTYEVSPPSWERPVCQVQLSGSTASTASPPMTMVGEASTSFADSTSIGDEPAALQMCNVELSGQLVGDISETLAKMDRQLGNASLVNVSCARLIRVDFIAAGDLLNWVLQRRSENRIVSFSESHRLVALFFGAMGINEHAKVKVRSV